jgi:hypothetical protein
MLAQFYDLEPLPDVRAIVEVTGDVQANFRPVTPDSRQQVSDDEVEVLP